MGAMAVNEQFRSYTQSTAFALTLGRTHIGALQGLEVALRANPSVGNGRLVLLRREAAMAALVKRGLVEYHPPDGYHDGFLGDNAERWKLSDLYTITTAGKLVLLLLAEAGLAESSYDHLRLLPPPPGFRKPVLDLSQDGVTTDKVADGFGGWTEEPHDAEAWRGWRPWA